MNKITSRDTSTDQSSQVEINVESASKPDLMLISQGLPTIFVNLLERRYLNDLSPKDWKIAPRSNDNALPVLREVVALGNPRHKAEWGAAMPHVLAACHEPGNGIVTTLFGDGQRSHLYIGARRLLGSGGRNTEEFLKSEEGAFKAFFNGLSLGDTQNSLNREEMPALTEFLETARSLAAVSGIPSWRRATLGIPFELQSLDQLVKAVGQQRYALMVVAEPVRPEEIDATMDVCRRLVGFIHTFASFTKSHGTSQTSSSKQVDSGDIDNSKTGLLSNARLLTGVISSIVGVASRSFPGVNPFLIYQGISLMLGGFEAKQSRGNQRQERSISTSDGSSEQISASFIDANAEACEKMLRDYLARIESAKSNGWWRTAVYIAAENEAVLASVGGALRSLCSGEATALDPIRILSVPEEVVRDAMTHGQVLSLRLQKGQEGHPFGESFDILGTCLTSEELAILINLPRTEIPGIPMRDLGEFCLSTTASTTPSIRLGSLRDSLGRNLSPVNISAKTLNRHVFVTGTTGYGKTNTCWQLLIQAYRELDVPFLVIEPAKAEYHRLSQIPELREELHIYNVGGGNGLPIRLNPFDWVPGIPLLRHINILKAIFSASLFPTGEDSPFPYIVESALYEVYLERGWNLHTSENPDLRQNSGLDRDRSALLPTLEDFSHKAEEILLRRDYDAPTQQRLLGALTVRMRSLLTGTKGLSLNTRRSTPLGNLFNRPTVIELSNLGNEEEKAFLMALLFSLLYEDAEVRAKNRPANLPERLQHITLIEEAHCLLKATGSAGSRRYSDPAAKAVDMFSDMLAEMRAYGEGFIIVDQIPTKLAPDILKNTGLKIIHRLTDPSERKVAGDCVNLNEWQIRHLNNLTEGLAVTHFEESAEPILCYVPLIKDFAPKLSDAKRSEMAAIQNQKEAVHMQRHAGCIKCPSPCQFFDKIDTASENYSFQKAPLLAAERRAKTVATHSRAVNNSVPKIPLFASNHTGGDLIASLSDALLPCLQKILAERTEEAFELFKIWMQRAAQLVRGMTSDSGKLEFGVAYCTAAQAAHHLLGELALNRGLAVNGTRIALPSDLLRRERAAAALGILFAAWIEMTSYSPPPAGTVKELIGALFSEPPEQFRNNPYCGNCQARCQILPWASPYVRTAATNLRNVRDANAKLLRSSAITQLTESVRQVMRFTSSIDSGGQHTLHCILAQVHSVSLGSPDEFNPVVDDEMREEIAANIARAASIRTLP